MVFGLFLLYYVSGKRALWQYVEGFWEPKPVTTYLALHTEYAYCCYPVRGTQRGYDQDRQCILPQDPVRNVVIMFCRTCRVRMRRNGT